jgi:PPM family protein phosphatase
MLDTQFDQSALRRTKILIHRGCRACAPVYIGSMASKAQGYRLSASTALHRGDRQYQQDQVELLVHPQVSGCALGLIADGMGGKSGGRTASDQVVLTARQIFSRFSPSSDDPTEMLRQLVVESHLMIKLTAITAEEEPHSTIAAFLIHPQRSCFIAHAGDSRVYHFRGAEMASRTIDHSYVQRLIEEGKITEDQANTHPQANLLTGCLGTSQDPPISLSEIARLDVGDTVLACSDGLWHYLSPREFGAIVNALPPREASEMLVAKARQRSRGGGDNLSLVMVRVEALPPANKTVAPAAGGARKA